MLYRIILLITLLTTSVTLNAVVEGQFYPANRTELTKTVDMFITRATPKVPSAEPHAIIVPHAGYKYSGKTAAYGYKAIQKYSYDTIIIVGSSHYTNNDTISAYNQKYYQTPLGKVSIDLDITNALIKSHKKILFRPQAYTKEHSLEVQLPFIQRVQPKAKVVMLNMENQSYANSMILKESLLTLLSNTKKKILLVISTDLSHYHDYIKANKMDFKTTDYILAGDTNSMVRGLMGKRNEMCGFGGVLMLMELAKDMNWSKRNKVAQNNSGDVTADKKRVVGYTSIIYYEGAKATMLNESEQQILLNLVKETIKNKLSDKPLPSIETAEESLKQVSGIFVTLKQEHQLRGCIGNIIGVYPLIEGAQKMALSAAFNDPRFRPVVAAEYDSLDFEISVLTPPKSIKDPQKEIEVGRHGIILKKGMSQGVLLPQVPLEQGWDLNAYLVGISHKSGLPSDGWKGAELLTFEAQVFP